VIFQKGKPVMAYISTLKIILASSFLFGKMPKKENSMAYINSPKVLWHQIFFFGKFLF